MRLPLRLLAVMAMALGLVGGVLALTVFDTDEESSSSGSKASGKVPMTSTEPALNPVPAPPERVVPQPIYGPLLGVNLTAYTRDGYERPSVQKAIGTLAELGSTAITLVPTWYMSSSSGNRIEPDEAKSPSDGSLDKVIEWIREAGMQVILKPHVDVIDDSYRGEIQPADLDQWFESYKKFIDHYSSFASKHSVDLFVVGTELKTISTETDRWRDVIGGARAKYVGPMTYAANWDEVDQVQFWDHLDAIGVDAYYELSPDDGSTPTLKTLVKSWRDIGERLQAASERWHRPVLLTEVGYPSQTGGTAKPYDVTSQPADQALQALAYKATFKALSDADWLKGISWWSWRADPSDEEGHETGYSPEGKQAEKELDVGQATFIGG